MTVPSSRVIVTPRCHAIHEQIQVPARREVSISTFGTTPATGWFQRRNDFAHPQMRTPVCNSSASMMLALTRVNGSLGDRYIRFQNVVPFRPEVNTFRTILSSSLPRHAVQKISASAIMRAPTFAYGYR